MNEKDLWLMNLESRLEQLEEIIAIEFGELTDDEVNIQMQSYGETVRLPIRIQKVGRRNVTASTPSGSLTLESVIFPHSMVPLLWEGDQLEVLVGFKNKQWHVIRVLPIPKCLCPNCRAATERLVH